MTVKGIRYLLKTSLGMIIERTFPKQGKLVMDIPNAEEAIKLSKNPEKFDKKSNEIALAKTYIVIREAISKGNRYAISRETSDHVCRTLREKGYSVTKPANTTYSNDYLYIKW